MNLLNVSDIESRGIRGSSDAGTRRLYENMVRWGWIDGLGRSRDWEHWQKFAPKYHKEKE